MTLNWLVAPARSLARDADLYVDELFRDAPSLGATVLRARVTSKGGTTEAALASMARDRVRESIVRAVNAAQQRSRELGDEFGKQ